MFLLAKAYFDLKEYRRCAHALRNVPGPKALFLRCYSQYLAGEKRKAEEVVELAGMHAGRGGSACVRRWSARHNGNTYPPSVTARFRPSLLPPARASADAYPVVLRVRPTGDPPLLSTPP